jgi:hypothetical protein
MNTYMLSFVGLNTAYIFRTLLLSFPRIVSYIEPKNRFQGIDFASLCSLCDINFSVLSVLLCVGQNFESLVVVKKKNNFVTFRHRVAC